MTEPVPIAPAHLAMRFIFVFAAALAGALMLAGLAATAAQSPWVAATESKVRLIGGAAPGEDAGTMLAGVHIHMDDGWKTYWRSPGDSGVPPRFDWAGSKNLKQAEVLYPAPHRFADASGTAIGYTGEVVFPVKLTPERKDEPIELKLGLDYGLCKSLCIPNQANLSLSLAPGAAPDPGDVLLLDSVLGRVPKQAAPGELPAVATVEAKLDGPKPEIFVDTQFPPGATGSDLFIDAPDGTYVPVPKAVGPLVDGKQRFTVTFASKDEAKDIKGKTLTLTLVYDGGGRVTTWKAE